MSSAFKTSWASVGRILRVVCVLAMICVAFCELRLGLISKFTKSPSSSAPSPFSSEPPSYDRSVSISSAQADSRLQLLGAFRAREIPVTWELPPHLSPSPGADTDPESGLPLEVRNGRDGSTMLLVPGGPFLMGAPDSCRDDRGYWDAPVHKVTLTPYYVAKFETTRGQYDRFCAETGHRCIPETMARLCPEDDFPVCGVTLDDASAYCAWAAADLPTEAQWEKAARGVDARLYPWGNECPDRGGQSYALFLLSHLGPADRKPTGPMRVGSFPRGASPYGALDMSGNVGEWCRDLFDSAYHSRSPSFNPTGPSRSNYFVIRGGSWRSVMGSTQTWWRVGRPWVEIPQADMGFRTVVNPRFRTTASRSARRAGAREGGGTPARPAVPAGGRSRSMAVSLPIPSTRPD